MEDEYRRGHLRGFAVLAPVLVVIEDERRGDGRIVIERIGEEVFLRWCGLLIWIAQEVFEGERAQFEEVGGDDLKISLRLGLRGRWRWRWCG